jgi:RNA polymerase sigma-70 factor (ECF subfamily)
LEVIGALLDAAQPTANELESADGFAAAVEPFLPLLGRVASRIASRERRDDVLQEALLRAWSHRHRYDPAKGSLINWLLTIVANESRRAARRSKVWSPLRPSAAAVDVASEDNLDLNAATSRLPERQRLAVDCFYFIGLSVAQTAAVMGCSEGTVKSTLSDARKRLRLELEES